jgi:hypothetical protein
VVDGTLLIRLAPVTRFGGVMKLLVWIGIAMVICWALLWLGIKIAVGAVHLLLLLGVVLIGWGLLHRGRGTQA